MAKVTKVRLLKTELRSSEFYGPHDVVVYNVRLRITLDTGRQFETPGTRYVLSNSADGQSVVGSVTENKWIGAAKVTGQGLGGYRPTAKVKKGQRYN